MIASQMRPRHIALKGDFVLSLKDGLSWEVKTHPILSRTGKTSLRELLHRLAHDPVIRREYGGSHLQPSDWATPLYGMVADIRRTYGNVFAWKLVAPDTSAIMLLDELDDYVCESRAWLRAGGITPFVECHVANGTTVRTRELPTTDQHERAMAVLSSIVRHRNARVAGFVRPNEEIPRLRMRGHAELIVFSDENGQDIFVIDAGTSLKPQRIAENLALATEIISLCQIS